MSGISAQLKSLVYLSVAKMVEQQTAELGTSASPLFVAALVELVYNQMISLGEDLELFANHAGRATVEPADVYMVTRKNEILTKALKELEASLQ